MKYTPYKERKETYDDAIFTYIASRIFESPKDSDQVINGVTDEAGQLTKEMSHDDYWKLTDLDKLIRHLKSALGSKRLQYFIGEYNHVKDLDPLFIMNMSSKTPIKKIKKGLLEIISNVEDRSFLPDYTQRKEPDYIESDTDIRKRSSFALTVLNFLLYTFKESKFPTSIDFKLNIMPSVECTFNIRPVTEYDTVKDYVIQSNLADFNAITKAGIRLVVKCASICENNGLLNDTIKDAHNYGNSYRRLAKV